ncbi:MAG: AraC family transcriptional regulator [Lachnospiraceae bacterium]|nr:AraC family transcriptional regulator [Lachnospiraceae bacterium]
MRTLYTSLDIHFTVENTRFHASNIVFERFLRTIPNHSHGARSYEIHYIPDGFGKARINQKYYEIKPNTLYVTGPHIEHFQIPDPQNPMSEYCVYIKIDSPRKNGAADQSDSIAECFQQYPFWFGQDTQNIHALMQKLFFELEHQYLGYKEEVQSLLCQLIISMVRNYRQIHKSSSPFTGSSINDSKAIITEEYFLYEYQKLSLEELANRLGLSPRQTERYLKEHYGRTFLQKKTESRMSTAAILLSDLSRSITSVSEELGYSSIEHFSSAFRRYYGCSAREYRARLNPPPEET